MRVLQIGQLPKEMGGNYTTGVARVVGELSRYKFGSNDIFLYATNLSNEKAQKLHSNCCSYLGYVKRPLHMIAHMLLHPYQTMKAYRIYRVTDRATSFLHMEFIRDNFERVIKKTKPDLIHYHGVALSAMHFANLRKQIPILYSPHAMVWVDKKKDDAKQDSVIKTAMLTLSFADYYTALNTSVVERMKLLDVAGEKIYLVPNGVDSNKFYYSESARRELRKTMGINDGTYVFISVGLIIDRKGQLDFLKILQTLGINYQYWIIGKGPDEVAIRQYVKENSIQDRVKFLGYVEDKDIYKYHSAADIYAHASYFEAQALSEIEAFACGLRIIVNKVIADTVVGSPASDMNNYYIISFDNVNRREMSLWIERNSPQRASCKQYDWQFIADMYSKVYEDVLS